jgi:signal peptidase I
MIWEEKRKGGDFLKGRAKRGMAVYFAVTALLSVVFKAALMLSFVPSGSMENTIRLGSFLVSTRFDVGAENLERYDVLIFTPPDCPDETYVKRLIGLPGETVEVRDGKVYADGAELDGSFGKGPQNRIGDGVYNVPEGCYFFLGDNRNHSYDSRFWKEKYVPLENIKARAKYIVFPFADAGPL